MSAATIARPAGPLSLVLAELQAGAPTVQELARRVGLTEAVVRAAVDHLVRSGRIESRELPVGCPPEGCGGCASSGDCGSPSVAPGRRGLVTLTLSRRP